MIGSVGKGAATGLHSTLTTGGASGLRIMKVLDTAGFSLATADSVALFDGESVAGEIRTVSVMAGGLLCIAAPGGPMSPELQNVATEVVVFIELHNDCVSV